MTYFKYIDNGEGLTKLFIGGLHGNEGETSIRFIKKIKHKDLCDGQFYFYNFNRTPYISTIKKEYYKSPIGKKVLNIITRIKPDFYTELHCYNIKNYSSLTSKERYEKTGIPPLIPLNNYILVSSVSPLIRMTYFSCETVCKTLEFPCIEKLTPHTMEKYDFNEKQATDTYMKLLKLIAESPSRQNFESQMLKNYAPQVNLAIKYASKVFGDDFPPY